jgi:hypothetical protein
VICAPLNLAFIRVVYRCAVDYGEAKWPPACSFGSLVPDEAQVPGNFEATHPLEGRGCGLGLLLTTAAYEAIKQRNFGNLTPWESHTIAIFYCATLVFILSALFLQREAANVHESSALNQSLVESLPGVSAYSILGAISGTTFAMTEKSSSSLMGFEICCTVCRLSGATAPMIPVLNIHRSPEAKDLVRR